MHSAVHTRPSRADASVQNIWQHPALSPSARLERKPSEPILLMHIFRSCGRFPPAGSGVDHFAHLGGLRSTRDSSPLIIFALFQLISHTDRAASAAGWRLSIRARVSVRTHYRARVKASVPAANRVSVCLELGVGECV